LPPSLSCSNLCWISENPASHIRMCSSISAARTSKRLVARQGRSLAALWDYTVDVVLLD